MLPINPQDIFAFVAGIVAMGCFTGIVVTFIKYRAGRQTAAPELLRRLDEVIERIGRLDNAVDTVAVEIERISEAQRFTSRILAERGGNPALPDKTDKADKADKARAGGSNTSH